MATYLLTKVAVNLHVVDVGPSAPPHPIRGKIANTTKESQLMRREQTNSFIVTQLLYLNGHLMAINLSTLTNSMFMFDAPPKSTAKQTTTRHGIEGSGLVSRKIATRSGIARAAWHKSATAKLARKRSDIERRFRLIAMAANTSKFPPKARADIKIKQTAVITELV